MAIKRFLFGNQKSQTIMYYVGHIYEYNVSEELVEEEGILGIQEREK
jgi:hypothetical protein